MNKGITRIAHLLAGHLNGFAAFLERTGRPVTTQSKFVDLAPTDQADKAGIYADALLYATNNVKVFNIALTGPYGSGKSSIIQSFLKKYRRPALHISLAAFVPEAGAVGGKVSRQEIERSILQQMLYGADANKLPLSRFKRIQSPGPWSKLTSLFIAAGLVSLWYIFSKRDSIIKGSFIDSLEASNWPNIAATFIAAAFLWTTIHHFYVASLGLSLKSISLKDVEIRPASDNLDSILNRHLDEIIYFFQSTKYDLVIIEDLDRFDDAEIFVTLREINSLVNENASVSRNIRFLYALRDDIFVNTDRTKFFEFIIPVIPIINMSNSIDMVLEQGKRLELDGRLDRQFLREVSRYLNDLRLIQNIFNEYAIYVGNLESDDENVLDANKLLAILIYKNVYPRDFEQLHRGEGNLAHILNLQEELVAYGEAAHRSKIAELEQKIETAERQLPSNLKELRQIYAMAVMEKLPAQVINVSHDGQAWATPQQLSNHDAFDQLIESRQIHYRSGNGYTQRLDISGLQGEVDHQKSYLQRKAEIGGKNELIKNESLRRIRDLRSKIATLRTIKFNELVRLNTSRLNDLFVGFGDKGELARFLILEGYLDDTYYQYTSLFHSGRLSPNDNKFLIQIRAFTTPAPNFPIDNPKEVVEAMRDEDFRQSYALNVKLVDCLLSDGIRYADQRKKFFEFVSSEFESCEDFFEAYYAAGHDVGGLLSGLTETWGKFIPTAIASPKNLSHVTQLLATVPMDALNALASEFEELSAFVSANLPEVLAHAPELAPERLECLGFEVKDLAAIREYPGIVRFIFQKSLFALTITNLEYIHHEILGVNDLTPLRVSNYTTLRSTNNSVLLERVERDFGLYLKDVLLKLPENTREDDSAIIDIARREYLDIDDINKFIRQQVVVLTTLEGVPARLHAVLFESAGIEPTWSNCLAFIEGDGFEEEILVTYLDREDVRAVILKDPISSDAATRPLRKFLIEAAALSDAAYREFVHALPMPFQKFPNDLERTKLGILISEGKVTFSKDSLDALADDKDLQVHFVVSNIATYLAEPDKFALDDDFREELLQAGMRDEESRAVIGLMDLSTLADLPTRAALIGPILDRTDANLIELDANVVRSLILHSRPIETQISLFNKCHSDLSDTDVRQVLASLPRPFSEITTGYISPRLTNSAENTALVKWLDSRNIISSWSEGWFLTDDIRVNLYRK